MDSRADSVMIKALETWGEDSQILMGLEECGELIAVLSQYIRGRRTKEDVAEEIADVTLMVCQLRRIFGPDEVDRIQAAKLDRLEQKLGADDTRKVTGMLIKEDIARKAAAAAVEFEPLTNNHSPELIRFSRQAFERGYYRGVLDAK